ncbi:8239_t:CDS:2 [Diversispora eburnea]|uniref:8239_t:CDS:1 n=1 Tax=Diversispora eburnea TaxID=1213867 RepID=A0A9N9FFQ5_9GLOM|nr:8239_t:CDS:2 [Diversispora eburnea]
MVFQESYKRIIILGLDGVGRFLTETETPNIDAFFASGASSLKAKAVVPTDSAENWGSLLHGVLPHKHGLRNGDVDAGIPYDENNPYPTWESINTGIIELSVKVDLYAPLTHENFFFKWWLRFKHKIKNSIFDYSVVSRLVDYIHDPKNRDVKLIFVHLTDVDEYGHGHNYGSQTYLEQIKVLDSHIGKILEAIDKEGWNDDSLVIMTTDHGGIGTSHGGKSDEEVNVFLAVRGEGIEPNSKIESEVCNMDCAALIVKALGMEIPEWFDAKLPIEFA